MIEESVLNRVAATLRACVEETLDENLFSIESTGPDWCFSLWIDRKDGTVGCWYRRLCEFGADIQVSFHCDEIAFVEIDGNPTVRFWRHEKAGRIPVMQIVTIDGAVWAIRYSALGRVGGGFGQV